MKYCIFCAGPSNGAPLRNYEKKKLFALFIESLFFGLSTIRNGTHIYTCKNMCFAAHWTIGEREKVSTISPEVHNNNE